MTKQEIIRKVNDLVVNKLAVEDDIIKEDANLESDLGADSLDVVELMMDVEKDFEIVIPDDEVGGVKTIGDIYNIVEEKLKKK